MANHTIPDTPNDSMDAPFESPAGAGVDLDEVGSAERQRVLVVEDELDTVFLLKQVLRMAGFNVLSATTGHEALKKVSDLNPDLVLLDIMMPEMDGWEIFSYLRKISDIPVIVVSALGEKDNVVDGLHKGVDDYIPKPFHNAEVVARVKAVLRRVGRAQEVSRLVFPGIGLVVDMNSQEVTLNDQSVLLTPKEFAILAILAKHAPAIVSYQTITEAVWGADTDEARKRAKYLIYLVRRKFESVAPSLDLILNVDRIGYKLQTEE